MKSKIAIIAITVMATLVLWQAETVFDDGPSFREQILQTVALKESGLITQREYKSLKRHIFNVMVH